ncbi:uncharacterized protein C57A10.07 [Wolffia australiana]
MSSLVLGQEGSKSFNAYPGVEFDLESGAPRKSWRGRGSPHEKSRMSWNVGNNFIYFQKTHAVAFLTLLLILGVTILIILSVSFSDLRIVHSLHAQEADNGYYPLPDLHSLVMVAGHSIYTSSNCAKVDREDSWFLEPYQMHPGQAATFLSHIEEGVRIAAEEDDALLLFSGGETRKKAGPRSEAQSYWAVAESKKWFGKREVRRRTLTEEYARDSFENLLFSICRFRELTGSYPRNITVVSYDFKKERFSRLHRAAIGFPEKSFSFVGTPDAPQAREASAKGEVTVRAQFQHDPFGCSGPLRSKRLRRDPFHRSIPYPASCPELSGLFAYCGSVPYPGSLPWSHNKTVATF